MSPIQSIHPWKAGDVVVFKQYGGSRGARVARIIDGHVDPKGTMRVYLRRETRLRELYGEWTTTPTRLRAAYILRLASDQDLDSPTLIVERPARQPVAPAWLPNSSIPEPGERFLAALASTQSKGDVLEQYHKDRALVREFDELMRLAEDANEKGQEHADQHVVERIWAHAKTELPGLAFDRFPSTNTEAIDLLFDVEEYVLERQRHAQEILSGRRYGDTKRASIALTNHSSN